MPGKALAEVVKRLIDASYPLTGPSDDGVSKALYFDPDGNGVELYRDRPVEEWPRDANGNLTMYSHHLDLEDLLKEADAPDEDVPDGRRTSSPRLRARRRWSLRNRSCESPVSFA